MEEMEIESILLRFKLGKKSLKESVNDINQIFTTQNNGFKNVKIGDFLRCDRVYPQSKKYTVGNKYQVIKKRDSFSLKEDFEFAIRDDNGKLNWIRSSGISFTDFTVINS